MWALFIATECYPISLRSPDQSRVMIYTPVIVFTRTEEKHIPPRFVIAQMITVTRVISISGSSPHNSIVFCDMYLQRPISERTA